MPTFTRANLKSAIAGRIHGKTGIIPDINVTVNNAVRDVISKMDLRSMKRKASLAPNLFNEIYQYTSPTDIKGQKVISLQPQNMERSKHQDWELVSDDEFDRRKQHDFNLLAFTQSDLVRKLLVSANIDTSVLTVSALDVDDGWSAFGDGTNLSTDIDEYIKGSGSVKWDISAAGGTTAGIENTALSIYDLTNYKSAGSVFVWAWVTSATNLTNFKIRLGSDSSNYYEMTATTTNEGAAFATGWNLLRFDFSGKTTTGTPDDDACDYAALYITKTAGKISETDYRFDHIIVARGEIHKLVYYSKYAWQNNSGTWIEDSTADTDYINCDTEEYNLFVEKLVEHASNEAREYEDRDEAKSNFKDLKKEYERNYKSEALQLQDTYMNF